MIDPDRIQIDPGRELERVAELAEEQAHLNARAFEPVKSKLDLAYSVGVVLVGDAPDEVITEGVKASYDPDDVVHLGWKALHDQEIEVDEVEGVKQHIINLRRRKGSEGLIVIEGTEFSPLQQQLVNPIGQRLLEMVMDQNRTKQGSKRRNEPAILAVGHGTPDDLKISDAFLREEYRSSGLTDQLALRLGLLPNGSFQAWTMVASGEVVRRRSDTYAAERPSVQRPARKRRKP